MRAFRHQDLAEPARPRRIARGKTAVDHLLEIERERASLPLISIVPGRFSP
jgi:hypothetical protein